MYKPSAKHLFFASIALQAVFLLGLIVFNQLTLVTGKEILLRTEPVDPRSLFQGDYVILRYGISLINLSDIEIAQADAAKLKDGLSVYVALEPVSGEKYYHPVAVSLGKPQSGIFMRGKINYVNFAQSGTDCVLNDCANQAPKPISLNLKYGIESYFVPEGKGRELEQVNRRGRAPLLVGVAVDGNGHGLIKSLVIDETSIDATDISKVVEVASTTANTYENQRQRTEADSELTTLMRDISDALQEYRSQQYVYPAKGQGLPPYDALAKLATDDDARFRYLKARADNLKGNIVWLDNSTYADGYCAFAQSVRDPQVWYLIDSNIAIIDTPRELDRQPLALADCGVVVKQSVATIEGYIFIDSNGNKVFDDGDKPFIDADISLNKLFDDQNGWERTIKPESDGRFKFTVQDEGAFGLGAHSNLATPVIFNYSKTNSITVKQGDANTYNNIIVSF